MSDTVQVVIDIPQDRYEYIKALNDGNTDYQTTLNLYKAIKNGTPLDDIKAEIKQVVEEEADDKRWSRGLHYALKIIDRHTGKERVND